MDRLKDNKNKEKEEVKAEEGEKRGEGLFGGALNEAREKGKRRYTDKRNLVTDLSLVAIALLLTRCNTVFGAHPLGLAAVAVLPFGVWQTLVGAIIGSLTLGRGGMIYAMVTAIIAFLRIIISGGPKRDCAMFSEPLLLRMSVATIGGFIVAVYGALLSGFTEGALLFGVSTVLLPPILTFLLSGLFVTNIEPREIVFGKSNIFSMTGKGRAEKYNLIFFQIAALVLLFFLTLSLSELEFFGISMPYIFVTAITLLVAKRFGALRAMAVGFASSLGISAVYSVSFALGGLGAGALFGLGTAVGIIGGGAALSGWSAYSAGLSGFLTTLPEYIIGAMLTLPILRGVCAERTEEETKAVTESATDMVGTVALAYRARYNASLDSLQASLTSLSTMLRQNGGSGVKLGEEDYKLLITEVVRKDCRGCGENELCRKENIEPAIKKLSELAKKLASGKKLTSDDIQADREFCARAEEVAEEINRAAAKAERDSYRLCEIDATADEYALIAGLINEARLKDAAERQLDAAMSEKLSEILPRCGFSDGVIKVFGERRKHLIMAGEDESGTRITSDELKRSIEETAGIRLGNAEFFRKESLALMECDIRRIYRVECATAMLPAKEGEISGDTAIAFESKDDRFYGLLSDGMGKGAGAKEASGFVSEFLPRILDLGAATDSTLHMLNHALRRRGEECSATVDLFEFDLLSGEATFHKCGAAASYVKRGSSLFRIRSQTAPLGVMRKIDCERVRVEVKPADYIIMLSDGISQSFEDAPKRCQAQSKGVRRLYSARGGKARCFG